MKHELFFRIMFLYQVKEKWESRSKMTAEDIASLEHQVEGSQWSLAKFKLYKNVNNFLTKCSKNTLFVLFSYFEQFIKLKCFI